MFSGKRIESADYFDDVQDTKGILDSQGLTDYNSLSQKAVADGMQVTTNCWRCNQRQIAVAGWDELFVVGLNGPGRPLRLPRSEGICEWFYSDSNKTICMAFRCPKCGGDKGIAIHFTPDEAARHVKDAVNAGLISLPTYNAWMQKVGVR